MGCQTVFISRNFSISQGLWESPLEKTTRLTFSAASRSRSARAPSAPVTSIAFTSMCPASHGASSSRCPVRTFTEPAGKSDVAIASASSIAATGCASEATATTGEIEAAARQFVRKLSGYREPSAKNTEAFEKAIVEVALASRRMLESIGVPVEEGPDRWTPRVHSHPHTA